MKRGFTGVLALALTLLSVASICRAGDMDLGQDFHQELQLSHPAAKKGKEKEKKGRSAGQEIAQLRANAGRIRADNAKLKENFADVEGEVELLGLSAVERHKVMEDKYDQAMEEYLSLIEGLPPGKKATAEDRDTFNPQLDKTPHKEKSSVLKTLPFRKLNHHPIAKTKKGCFLSEK